MALLNAPKVPEPKALPQYMVGAASPLWAYFGAAAAGGVAIWWMTRWARTTNLEAVLAKTAPAPEPVVEPAVTLVEAEPIVEAASEPVLEAALEPEPVAEATVEPEPVIEAAPDAVVEAEPEPEPVVQAAQEPEPVMEAASETAPEPVAEPVVDIAPEPVVEAAPEPVADPEPAAAPTTAEASASDAYAWVEPEVTMGFDPPVAVEPDAAPAEPVKAKARKKASKA